MRKAAILAADLGWVALSAFLAVLIRDNFVADWAKLAAVVPYAAIAVAAGALVFLVAGISNTLWRYTALSDVLRIMAAATVALLLTLFVSFVFNRLEGVARSVPVIQWLLLVGGMLGSRVAYRVWHDRTNRRDWNGKSAADQFALIVGVNHLTELYLEAAAKYAPKTLHIVGLLTDRREFHGRLLRRQRILGTSEDLLNVMQQLDIHGVSISRILVVKPYESLSPPVREALSMIEQAGSIKVDWLVESLGLSNIGDGAGSPAQEQPVQQLNLSTSRNALPPWLGRRRYAKRIFDIALAVALAPVLVPVSLIVALIVALDVGLPVVFWQQRPGRNGRPFKLFKFRTMRAAHDEYGNRRSDEERSSVFGRLLRRTRLDELPQLYNVVVGEMSLVGPRPLLPQDQPDHFHTRLMTRPGLTGYAQVNGGRDLPADAKNTLDLWYVENASLWLDIRILCRTLVVLTLGERSNDDAVQAARTALTCPAKEDAGNVRPHLSPQAENAGLVATAESVRSALARPATKDAANAPSRLSPKAEEPRLVATAGSVR